MINNNIFKRKYSHYYKISQKLATNFNFNLEISEGKS